MKYLFAPGCALILYKPHLVEKIHDTLNKELGQMERLTTCCRNEPRLEPGTRVINICPGCDRRYAANYSESDTLSLWEVLAQSDFFPFPDYQGLEMSINDACPTRDQDRVHLAVRSLLKKMNITLIEPQNTGQKSICCGDTFWGVLPTEKVKEQMTKRASEMPKDDVVVYCVSCSKSMFIGGKTPRYLVDLLYNEKTEKQTLEPDLWHAQLDDFIAQH